MEQIGRKKMKTAVNQPPPLGTPLNYSNPLTQGLVGCYLLNEGGGKIAKDVTGRNIDGSLLNGAVYKQSSQWGVVSFDGVDDYIDITPTVYTPDIPVTLAAWVNPGVSGTVIILSIGSSSTNEVFIMQNGSKFASQSQISGTQARANSTTTLAVGTWYFVVGVLATNTLRKIYVNGKFEAQDTTNIAVTSATGAIYIGKSHGSALPYKGLIQNAMVWKRILTDSEIRQLYVSPYSMYVAK